MTDPSIPITNHYVALVKLEIAGEPFGFIEEIAWDLIKSLDLNVVKEIKHTFHPGGTTFAFILSESHLLIHTWPELGMIHIDLVTCSHCGREEFEDSLKVAFSEQKVKSIEIKSVSFD